MNINPKLEYRNFDIRILHRIDSYFTIRIKLTIIYIIKIFQIDTYFYALAPVPR